MHVQMTAICNLPNELYFLTFNAYLCILSNLNVFTMLSILSAMLLRQDSFHIIYSMSGSYVIKCSRKLVFEANSNDISIFKTF